MYYRQTSRTVSRRYIFFDWTVQTAEVCAQNLSPWNCENLWTKVERQLAEEKLIKKVWNIFENLNAFHIASTRLRVVILYEVGGNGKKIYLAQQNQEPLSQLVN